MRNFLKEFMNRKKDPKQQLELAAQKRQEIMADGNVAKRLLENPDFIRFCELLNDDREALNLNLLQENPKEIKNHEQNVRLIARINQIDKILGKPKSMIWQMENLTEVSTAKKEQTRERQALGNKTGGEQDGN